MKNFETRNVFIFFEMLLKPEVENLGQTPLNHTVTDSPDAVNRSRAGLPIIQISFLKTLLASKLKMLLNLT